MSECCIWGSNLIFVNYLKHVSVKLKNICYTWCFWKIVVSKFRTWIFYWFMRVECSFRSFRLNKCFNWTPDTLAKSLASETKLTDNKYIYMVLPFRIILCGSGWQSRKSDTGDDLVQFCFVISKCGVIYRLHRVCKYGRDRLELFILSKNIGRLQ